MDFDEYLDKKYPKTAPPAFDKQESTPSAFDRYLDRRETPGIGKPESAIGGRAAESAPTAADTLATLAKRVPARFQASVRTSVRAMAGCDGRTAGVRRGTARSRTQGTYTDPVGGR